MWLDIDIFFRLDIPTLEVAVASAINIKCGNWKSDLADNYEVTSGCVTRSQFEPIMLCRGLYGTWKEQFWECDVTDVITAGSLAILRLEYVSQLSAA